MRETWYCDDWRAKAASYKGTPAQTHEWAKLLEYRATHDCSTWEAGCPCSDEGRSRWKPSIHMPRWASRITLEVTKVRVQRVQDITEADAVSEGVVQECNGHRLYPGTGAARARETARQAFVRLWDSLNRKRGYSWESNPWVWAITFRRLP